MHVRLPPAKAKITKWIGRHSFRHSLASHLGQQGEDVKGVEELLHHANSRITWDALVVNPSAPSTFHPGPLPYSGKGLDFARNSESCSKLVPLPYDRIFRYLKNSFQFAPPVGPQLVNAQNIYVPLDRSDRLVLALPQGCQTPSECSMLWLRSDHSASVHLVSAEHRYEYC